MERSSIALPRGYTWERWAMFAHQVCALADLAPESLLEVGVGSGVTGAMLRAAYPGCRYDSLDLEPGRGAHHVGDVRAMPFPDGAFDAALCCQVLEHIPYEDVPVALAELRRVTRRRVVLSLPDVRPFIYLRARPPASRRYLPWLWRGVSMPSLLPKTHRFEFEGRGKHHWEIGKRGYPLGRLVAELREVGWSQPRSFRMVERPYWHFFLLDHG